MQRLLEHLDRLNNKVVQELTNSSDPVLQKYVSLFDRSCSNPAQVTLLYYFLHIMHERADSDAFVRASQSLGSFNARV